MCTLHEFLDWGTIYRALWTTSLAFFIYRVSITYFGTNTESVLVTSFGSAEEIFVRIFIAAAQMRELPAQDREISLDV